MFKGWVNNNLTVVVINKTMTYENEVSLVDELLCPLIAVGEWINYMSYNSKLPFWLRLPSIRTA